MNKSVWEDLLGVPFSWGGRDPATGLDCLGLVIEVYRRLGLRGIIPDPQGAWKRVRQGQDYIGEGLKESGWRKVPNSEIEAGALVILDAHGSKNADHVGIYLGAGKLLHAATEVGVQVIPLDALLFNGYRFLGAYNPPSSIPSLQEPTELAVIAPDTDPVSLVPDGEILLVMIPDPLREPGRKSVMSLPFSPGSVVGDIIPLEWKKRERRQVIALDQGGEVLPHEAPLSSKQIITLVMAPGGSDPLTAIGIALFLQAVSFVVQQALAPSLKKPSSVGEQGSNTFRLDGIRNTALPGIPIPIVYGEHIVGGNVISIFSTADENGRQILNMLIALSQGPIYSVAGLRGEQDLLSGQSIPEDIKINGTPAREFKNVQISTRVGDEAQTAIPGFSDSVTAIPFEVTLGTNEPFTHTTSDDVDAFQVLINFPSGLYTASRSGGSNLRSADFTFRWREAGTTTWASESIRYTEARRASFTKQFEKRGLARGTYEIQVERTAPAWPPATTSEVDQSDLVAINEIIDATLSYPGVALLGVRAMSDEQLPGGAPPTITSVVQGRTVYRYGPSGTGFDYFTTSPALDNYRVPAWVVLDLLINPIYGLAVNGNLSIDSIDIESFYEWSQLTQTSVSSGQGTNIPRAVCNTVLDTSKGGWETVVAIARSNYANLTIVGNKIRAVPMKARDPVALFNMSNVSDFSLKYVSRSSRPNVIEAEYRNEQTDFEQDIAQKYDDAIFNGSPIVQERLALIGATHPGQVYRNVQFRLNHAELIGKTVRFTAGADSIHLIPGDVIRVSHDAISWGTSARARTGATSTTIILDRDVTITAGDKMIVRTDGTGADVLQVRDISTTGAVAAGSPITVSTPWNSGDIPTVDDPVSLGASSTYIKDFEVESIETLPDLRRNISAVEYNAAVYNDDPGFVETFTEEYPDVRKIPNSVTALSLAEISLTLEDGGTVPAVDVYVTKAALNDGVDIYWKLQDSDSPSAADIEPSWQYVGRTYRDRYSFLGPGFGSNITVSAVPVSPNGTAAFADTGVKADLAILGKRDLPSSAAGLTGFCVEVSGDDLLIRTPEHPDKDVSEYVVYWSANADYIATSTPIAIAPAGDTLIIPSPDISTGKYLLFTPRNRTGREGVPYVETLSLQETAGNRLEFSQDEHSGWTGTKTNCSVSSGVLVMSAGVTSATYESAGLAFSDGYAHRTTSYIKDFLRLEQKDLDWDHAAFSWDDPRYAAMAWNTSTQIGYENDRFYTWRDAGFTWDSEICDVTKWEGPVDLIAATQPVVEIDYYNGSSWAGFEPSKARDVPGIEQIAAKLTLKAPTTGLWWRPEAYGLTSLGYVRDAGKYEVEDPNSDYGDGTSALTVASGMEQIGLVLRERYRRWPRLSCSAPHWVGSGATGVTPVGAHGGFSIILATGIADTIFVDTPTPAWAEDDSASNYLNVKVTWVGDQSTGGSAYGIAFLTGYRPWNESSTPATFAGLTAFDLQVTTIPAGYVAGQYITTTLTARKAFFGGAASLNGNASPLQWITTGIGRSAVGASGDTYGGTLGGNIYVIGIEINSGYKVT